MTMNAVEEYLPEFRDGGSDASNVKEHAALVREFVGGASRVLYWAVHSKARADTDAAPLKLYERILAHTDGMVPLIEQGSAASCNVVLRASLEAFLQLHYILQADQAERACAFIVGELRQELLLRERTLKELSGLSASSNAEDSEVRKMVLHGIDPDRVNRDMEHLKRRLTSPSLKATAEKYENLLKQRRKRYLKNWYELCGQAGDLRQLAKAVGYGWLYDVLYGQLSRGAHGTDVDSLGLFSTTFGLRSANGTATDAGYAISLGLGASLVVAKRFCPDQKALFVEWFKDEVYHRWSTL